MKKQEKKPSIKSETSKFAKSFIGIFRAIPKWIYVAFIPLFLGIGITVLFYESEENPNENLPNTQLINYQDTTYRYAYDGKTKGPAWTLQVLVPGEVEGDMTNIKFYEDEIVPDIIRAKLSDYQNSGFAIAPLLNASDGGIFSSELPLSTASSQDPSFFDGYWAKVNEYVKNLVKKLDVTRTLVITGPLYLPHEEPDTKRYVSYQVIGENNVAVPTHFFKAIFYPVEKPALLASSLISLMRA